MASALLEVAIQPAFQEKLSYTMAIRALLGGGSAMVCRMTAFTVENEKGSGGSCFRQFISNLVAWYVIMPWSPDEDSRAFSVVKWLTNRLDAMCVTLNCFK